MLVKETATSLKTLIPILFEMAATKEIVDGKLHCSTCKMVKEVSEFQNNKSTATGKMYSCKACRNAPPKITMKEGDPIRVAKLG